MHWLQTHWDYLLATTLATAAGALLASALFSILRAIWPRRRTLYLILLTASTVAAAVLLWLRMSLFRVYLAPLGTFVLGFGGGITWARWPGLRLGLASVVQARLGAARLASWGDPLTAQGLNSAKWAVVESDPAGMLQSTTAGLIVAWPAGQQFVRSGYAIARLDLSAAEFYIDIELRTERYGSGWNPGLALYADFHAGVGTSCCALRAVPAGAFGMEHAGIVFQVGGEIKGRWPVSPGVVAELRLQVDGRNAKASVDGSSSSEATMPDRPRRLLLGSYPWTGSYTGTHAHHTFRNLRVRRGSPVAPEPAPRAII